MEARQCTLPLVRVEGNGFEEEPDRIKRYRLRHPERVKQFARATIRRRKQKIREVAEILGLPPIVDTLKPCPKGHTQKYSRTGKCVGCTAEMNLRWRVERGDQLRASSLRSHNKFKEKRLRKAREWKAANAEHVAESHRQWRRQNPEKNTAQANKHRAAMLKAIPPWADFAAIEAIYAERRRVTEETGVVHHVDHIIPLLNPIVCGLHTQDNLRVVTQAENSRKQNRLCESLVGSLYVNAEIGALE